MKYAVTTKEGRITHHHYFPDKKSAEKFRKGSREWREVARGSDMGYSTYIGKVRKLKGKNR